MPLNYVLEALLLAIAMLVAALVSVTLGPAAAALHAHPSALGLRFAKGCAAGLTAMAIANSPPGRRSGAHLNPAVSLAFLYLRKIEPRHAVAYVCAQLCGATLGIGAAVVLWGQTLRRPQLHYLATTPGMRGALTALAAEAAISFCLMSVVLRSANTPRFAPYTGVFVGILIAASITLEAPLSGASLNPARTFGSDVFAAEWSSYWIYLLGPPAGMLAAAAVFGLTGGHARCAKIMHDPRGPCTFAACEYPRA